MPIVFYCPRGHRLKAPRRKIGQIIDCPVCQAAVIIPPESASPSVPSAAPPPLPPPAPSGKTVEPSEKVDEVATSPGDESVTAASELVDSVLAEVASEIPTGQKRTPPEPPPLPGGEAGEPIRSGPPPVQPPSPPAAERVDVYETVTDEAPPTPADPPDPQPPTAAQTTPPRKAPRPQPRVHSRRVRWLTPDVSRPEPSQLHALGWVVAYLALVTVFSALPALAHLKLATAPAWARVVLLTALIQGAYVAWLWSTPDWAAARVVTGVFALVAALYGMGTALVYATPLDAPMPLDLTAYRFHAGHWCAAVLLLMVLGTYLCGRLASRWHRRVGRATPLARR